MSAPRPQGGRVAAGDRKGDLLLRLSRCLAGRVRCADSWTLCRPYPLQISLSLRPLVAASVMVIVSPSILTRNACSFPTPFCNSGVPNRPNSTRSLYKSPLIV